MTAPDRQFSSLGPVLFVLVLLAMVMGTGPGTLLVNRAMTIKGIPLLYLWGIGWYLVLVTIAFVAYFRIWKADAGEETGDSA